MAKSTLDKDLGKVDTLETATASRARAMAMPGLLLVFFIGAITLASLFVIEGPLSWFVIAAAVIAAYMALNVGANDVANNMGPAVGSRALSLGGALVIAAFCEAAGAILAGGDVVNTVSRDLLRPDDAMPALQFILVMMSAFLAAAMWINLATCLGAPVSTTHSVVGGVVGAGIAAAGFWVVHWPMIGAIVGELGDLTRPRRTDCRSFARLRQMVDPVARGSCCGGTALGSGDGRADDRRFRHVSG